MYLLEPDVKNGPGGIRDLDIAHWAARARWRVHDLSELVRLGDPRSARMAEHRSGDATSRGAFETCSTCTPAGARIGLSFDRQEQLAEDLGYGSGGPAVERFMSDYYRHARVIERSRDMILSRAAPPPGRRPHAVSVGRGLTLVNGAVSLSHPAALDSEPALALRLYDEAVRRDVPVYEFARDSVARAASLPAFCEKLRASDEARRLFVRLATTAQRSKQRGGSILGELHDVGLLVAMIPEFSPVVGRVHHDVYHVYTVDAHSVAAVDKLARAGARRPGAEVSAGIPPRGGNRSTERALLRDAAPRRRQGHRRQESLRARLRAVRGDPRTFGDRRRRTFARQSTSCSSTCACTTWRRVEISTTRRRSRRSARKFTGARACGSSTS